MDPFDILKHLCCINYICKASSMIYNFPFKGEKIYLKEINANSLDFYNFVPRILNLCFPHLVWWQVL